MCVGREQASYIRTGGGEAAGREGDGGDGGEREGVHVLREVGRCSVWCEYADWVLRPREMEDVCTYTTQRCWRTDGADGLATGELGQVGHVGAGALALVGVAEAEGQRRGDGGDGGEEPEGERT